MKYFAQVNENNKVANVIVIDDSVLLNEEGIEVEQLGSDFCSIFGEGRWIQTSVDAKFRKIYAGVGDSYRDDVDAFQPPQVYPSWTFNDDTWKWEPPVPMPADGGWWSWDEDGEEWERISDS
jgi:hypothetical protein